MAAPSFVSNGALSSSSSAASLTPALPSSRTTDNLLVAFVQVLATGKTFSVGGGWTQGDSVNTGNMSAAWFYRIVDSTEAAPAITWTGSASCRAIVLQYTGNVTSSFFDTNNQATGNSATSGSVAAMSSTQDNDLAIIFTGISANASISGVVSAGYSSNYGTAQTNGGSTSICSGAMGATGSTDPLTPTFSSADWVTFGILLEGTGSGTSSARASMVVQEVLEDYGADANLRASMVVQEVLEDYGADANLRASMVVLEVLRTVNSATTAFNFGGII